MKYSAAVLGLLASAAIARPTSEERFNARQARRAASHGSTPLNRIGTGVSPNVAGNETQVSYSTNWSGSVITDPPSGEAWKTVTAEFTVPKPSGSSGASASAWVGIDGDTCSTAILQTGVDFTVGSGYDAWYEWYPDYAYDFTLSISEGDVIRTTVTASTKKAGKAVIENVTTGKTVTKAITSTSALCLENAEWIVEDFEEGSSLVTLADFGSVKFTNAKATTASGTVQGPADGTVLDIKQSGTVKTSVSTGSSSLTVKYV